ncbi:hypothetical protein RHMOL_Rhmol02G0041000 [Rhododendron molle]|uniref:Uncharacterized protein n=1 Tax=Rhododendron molle TaxID=49168 RepID=A0ACC0PLV2_RHOML|nr:hypothetical protein RHMOL_Rhmol02G0041000 [Rhododendron molle]
MHEYLPPQRTNLVRFPRHRFNLEIFCKNSCFDIVEGVQHLPGTLPVKLDSQDLLQIGNKEFYFLLPMRNILSSPTYSLYSLPPSSRRVKKKGGRGDDCVMADQLNSECLGKKKTKEKKPVGERRNKKTNGVRIAIPLEDILPTKGMRSKDAAKHLRVLTATVDTNSSFEKEILPPQFLPTAQQENPDAGLRNDEDEAIGMGVEGTGDGVMVEAQLNSGCLGKGKSKEKSPGGERGNKGTTGVRIAIANENILQIKGMRLKDAVKHL